MTEFDFVSSCDRCGNRSITLADGSCATCGHRKVSRESAELARQRIAGVPARSRWGWGRVLTLAAFTIVIAVILLSVERISRQ